MRSTNHVGKTTFYDMDIDVSRYDDIFCYSFIGFLFIYLFYCQFFCLA